MAGLKRLSLGSVPKKKEEKKSLITRVKDTLDMKKIFVARVVDAFPNALYPKRGVNLFKLEYIRTHGDLYKISQTFDELDSDAIFCIRCKDEVELDVISMLNWGSNPAVVREMMLYHKLGLDKRWCLEFDIDDHDLFKYLRHTLRGRSKKFEYSEYTYNELDELREDINGYRPFCIKAIKDLDLSSSLSNELYSFGSKYVEKTMWSNYEDLGFFEDDFKEFKYHDDDYALIKRYLQYSERGKLE